MRVIIAEREEEKQLSYKLRYQMYCLNLGWLPADNYTMQEEKDEYDKNQSLIFLAIDEEEIAIGTSRLILEGEIALPIEKHFKLYPKEVMEASYGVMGFCVEVSRFVVPKHKFYKEHETTLTLCKMMIRKSIEIGATHMFMSTDYRFFRLLKIIGYPLAQIGEPEFYMGSKTVPGIFPIKENASLNDNSGHNDKLHQFAAKSRGRRLKNSEWHSVNSG